jgi:hypothetical protein
VDAVGCHTFFRVLINTSVFDILEILNGYISPAPPATDDSGCEQRSLCHKVYTGQTGRSTETTLKEYHQHSDTGKPHNPAVTMHNFN